MLLKKSFNIISDNIDLYFCLFQIDYHKTLKYKYGFSAVHRFIMNIHIFPLTT